MTTAYRRNINALTVIAAAAFAGGNLFIGLSMGAIWMNMDPLDFMNGFWGQFTRFTFTIMPLFTLTLIGLILSARLDWANAPVKRLWLIAIGLYIATSAITMFYHLPLNFALRAAELTSNEAASARRGWLLWNVPRVVLAFGIPFFALKAMSAFQHSFEPQNEPST